MDFPDLAPDDLCVLVETLDLWGFPPRGTLVTVIEVDCRCDSCGQWHYIVSYGPNLGISAPRSWLKKIDDNDDARPYQVTEWFEGDVFTPLEVIENGEEKV